MKLKKTQKERKRSTDSPLSRAMKRVVIVLIFLVLMGLAGSHLLYLITGSELAAIPENQVSNAVTPIQSGFSSDSTGEPIPLTVAYFQTVMLTGAVGGGTFFHQFLWVKVLQIGQ